MCGAKHIRPDAAHIIDEKEWKSKDKKGNDSKFNGIPLCPNCHRVFDEVLRPRLYKALQDFARPDCRLDGKGTIKSRHD
jgi:hypothetical protein